jgi:hypothetical protein
MKAAGRVVCPTGSGQVRLWAGICALFVPALRPGVSIGVPERRLDALADQRVAAVEALGVDPEQDLDRVPSPLGHRGGRHAAVEPGGHGRVPQVVGRPRQR